MAENFTWRDGERTIRFGRGARADAPSLLGDDYTLLTTERALQAAPELGEAARAIELVASGRVDDLAGDMLERPQPPTAPFVALGGGRVIDVAKALGAAAGPDTVVAAIPTTLSAAEMTWVHRHARGVDGATPRVRPRLVLNDPELSASQPPDELAASAANALAHAIEGGATAMATPVPTLAARDAARRLAGAWAQEDGDPDRDELALGALLSGYAIDANWYGLHHVMSQTLVREAGVGHGPANAAMLPVTTAALRERNPAALDALDAAAGEAMEDVARRFAQLAHSARLRDLGVRQDALEGYAQAAAQRAELALTPPPAGPDELLGLYRRVW